MKRYVAAGLSALLLCGMCAPAYAADTQTDTGEQSETEEQTGPVKLSFDTLEQTVRENNITIKAYENTVKSAEETDVRDDFLFDSLELGSQINGYQQQINELERAIAELEGEGTEALRGSLEAQKEILQMQLDAALAQYDNLDDDEDDAEEEQEKTVVSTQREMQNAADQVCVNAEETYISLQTMQYSLNETDRSLAQLDRSIAAAEKQVAIGMAGPNTLKSLQSQRETLLASRQALETRMENLNNTLALQCGYTLGTELETEALPAVTQEQLDALDYEADLKEALENSYSIWAQKDALESASDDYANGVTDNLYAHDAAKIQLDAQTENVKASFREMYKDVQEKQAASAAALANLEQAQKTFAVQQVQYDRGMISRMDYMNAQDTLTAAEESAASAQIDLFTSYNTYQWAKRGVMSGAAQ